MRSLTILLALGLASSDKLDRTYLPPPGSKFAGGSPGSIEVPLEFPKETYSTTLRPVAGQTSPGDSRLTVGIDRGPTIPNIPIGSQNLGTITTRPQASITPFQDIYKIPSTTTSYAFTQTTTFPSEGFETTVSPALFNDFYQHTTGLPNHPQFSQGQLGNQIHPGYDHGIDQTNGQHFGAIGPSIQGPGFGSQSIPASQTFVAHPGYIQGLNQNQQALLPSSTISPITDINIQPELLQSPGQNKLTNYLGVQPPRQLIGQQSTFPDVHPSQVTHQNYQPGTPQYVDSSHNIQGTFTQGSKNSYGPEDQRPITVGSSRGNIPPTKYPQSITSNFQTDAPQYGTDLVNVQGNLAPGSNIPQQFSDQRQTTDGQQLQPTVFPQGPPSRFQPSNTQHITDVSNIQSSVTQGSSRPHQIEDQRPAHIFGQHGSLPSTITPQGSASGYKPSSQYITTTDPNISQTGTLPGHQIPDTQRGKPGIQLPHDEPLRPHQYPTSKPGDSSGSSHNIYLPDSTATSSILPPGYPNQPTFPSTSPSIFPSYGTSVSDNAYSPTTPSYPGIPHANISPIRPGYRPERPQAEFDRNAVILNYENVLTPEGYAYSFDTSNGIHADESGTATDGVKAQGSYSYTGDDGKIYSVIYSADENGFQPRGDHLPTPPPVPEAIQRVIDQAIKDKEAGISHDGFYDENKYGHKKYQQPKNRRTQTKDRVVNGAVIPDDYETESHETGKQKTGTHGGRKRPVTTTIDHYDGFDDLSKNQQHNEGGHIRNEKTKRPVNRVSASRRPSNKVPAQNEYESSYDEDTQQSHQPTGSTRVDPYKHRRPMNISSKPGSPMSFSSQEEKDYETQDELDDFEYESSFDKNNHPLPPHRKPTKNKGTKYVKYDEKLQDSNEEPVTGHQLMTGRPQGSKLPTVMSYTESSDVRHSQRLDSKSPMPQNVLNPSSTTTSNVEYEDYSEDIQQKPDLPGSIQQTTNMKPKGFKRPESKNTNIKSGKPRQPEASIPQIYDHREDNYDEESRQPTIDQHPTVTQNYQTQKQSDEELGYQYIVPRNKFDQSEKKGYPTRFPEVNSVTSTKEPYEISDSKTTIRPFMTPNVSRDDDESYEDNVDHKLPSRKPIKSSTGKTSPTPVTTQEDYDEEFETDTPEYNNSEIDTDQEMDDDNNAPTSILTGKPGTSRFTSTRRPTSGETRPTTIGPQFDEHSSDKKDRNGQKRPSQPGQMHDNQYSVESTERPEERPGKRTKITKTGYNLVSSTTPMPTQSSIRSDSSYSQYPSTYQTTDDYLTSDYSEDSVAPGFVTSRPGASSRLPGTRPTFRPSFGNLTTIPEFSSSQSEITESPGRTPFRPIIDYSESTTMQGPAIIRSGFPQITSGRPTSAPITDYGSTITPGITRATSTTIRPSTITDYDRITSPGYSTTKLGSMFPSRPGIQSQNIPSTTYRPNYNIADITNQPDDQSPGISVDRYGRPIYQPGTGVIGSTTFRPSISPTQESGTSTIGTYQDYTPISSLTLKPNEQRFGKPDYESTQGFTQQQGSVPSYQTNFMSQPSTERVIGEDFSGPKQPQRFDPQTGYHY